MIYHKNYKYFLVYYGPPNGRSLKTDLYYKRFFAGDCYVELCKGYNISNVHGSDVFRTLDAAICTLKLRYCYLTENEDSLKSYACRGDESSEIHGWWGYNVIRRFRTTQYRVAREKQRNQIIRDYLYSDARYPYNGIEMLFNKQYLTLAGYPFECILNDINLEDEYNADRD